MTDEVKSVPEDAIDGHDYLAEQVGVIYRTFDNMFLVPLNMDIYAFSDKWLSLSDKVRMRPSFANVGDPILTYQLAVYAIRPVESWAISFDEELESVSMESDDEHYDSQFKYDTDYTYRHLLVGIYAAASRLAQVETDDTNLEKLIKAVVDGFDGMVELLTSLDTVKQITRHSFSEMAVLATSIQLLADAVFDDEESEAVN